MSANINQIFLANPTTTFNANDIMYLGRSPYGASDDFAFTYSSLSAQFSPSALTDGNIFIGNGSNIATGVAMSGDATIINTGAITVTKTSGVSFSASATTDTTDASNISSGTLPSGRISGPYTGITEVGTLTSGVWNASLIDVIYGGTGQSTWTTGDILYSDASNSLAKLAGNTTTSKMFLSQTGDGINSASPLWEVIDGSDINGQALTRTDDTNVTLVLGGTPSTALLQPTSLTLGWTGQLSVTRGGTGLSSAVLGDILYSSAPNTLAALTGNITTTKKFLSQTGDSVNSAAPVWDDITGSDVTGAALTKADDTNVTLTLGGTPSTALLQATSMTLGWTGQLSLARGGSNASLTADNGGIIYSDSTGMAVLASTATANQVLLSGSSAAPSWSTATYPATTTINELLYSSAANTISGLPTAINSTLITSGTGVPSISSTLPIAVQNNITEVGTLTSGIWNASAITEVYGGTNQTSYILGDILYSSGANTLTKLAGNTTTSKLFLSQTGTGAVSAAPIWNNVEGTDVTGAALTKSDDTNVTLTLGGTPTTALLRAASLTLGWAGELSVPRGGTGISNFDEYAVVCGGTSSTGPLQQVASLGTAGQVLTSSGAGFLPSFETPVQAAAQSDQETATSTTTYVSPGRQQFHPSALKFWVRGDNSTTVVAGYNVSSITDNGSGDHTINLSTSFSSANYSATGLCSNNAWMSQDFANPTASTLRVFTQDDVGTVDAVRWWVMGAGDQ